MSLIAESQRARAWRVPVAVALAAWACSLVVPLLSPLLVALVVGGVLVNSRARQLPALREGPGAARFLLRLGIILLGFRLVLTDLADLGLAAIALVVSTVMVTFFVTVHCGKMLNVAPELTHLIASGFAVCGAAAIAAVQDTIKARQQDVALAVALVTLFGTVMIPLIPLAGDLLRLGDETTAVWAGASIHEVAQVVAAASLVGPLALPLAMGVKLGRVLMLAPVTALVAGRLKRGSARNVRRVPWFLQGFLVAVVLRATGLMPSLLLDLVNVVATVCLAAGMFGLGLGIVLRDLWPISPRVLALASIATATATAFPLVFLVPMS